MLKRIALGLLILLALLVAALGINTFRQRSVQTAVEPLAPLAVDEAAVAASLAEAIRARTVSSHDNASLNLDQFEQLHKHLAARYPRVHATLKREAVNGPSLLYTWEGSDSSLPAIALMAHQDVVPIAPGTEGDWQAPPFGGEVRDGYVWGRGAWDDKANLIAELEAVEMLLGAGFKPARTVYLVFGADEEVGGQRGALKIGQLLQQRGVKLEFIVDEGLTITEGILPGLKAPAALIGLAEKGYLSLRLDAKATPGHSSMPPPAGRAAVAQVAGAVHRLDSQPAPAAVDGIAAQMFDALAPELGGIQRVALSNRWLFEPLLVSQFEKGPATNALIRTTLAPTMLEAGNKDNVLPGRASAVVNLRLLPGTTRDAAVESVRQRIANEGIEITRLPGSSEPSPVSATDASGYRAIDRTVRELFPGTVVAPGLMLGATDARHLQPLTTQVYRFSPVRVKPEDLARFHGTNERIATANLVDLVRFYHRLLQQSAAAR